MDPHHRVKALLCRKTDAICECGVLGALKYKPDVLKPCKNPVVRRVVALATLQAQAQEVEKTPVNLRAAQQGLILDINFNHK